MNIGIKWIVYNPLIKMRFAFCNRLDIQIIVHIEILTIPMLSPSLKGDFYLDLHLKRQSVKDIFLHIHSRINFYQFQSLRSKPEHAAFCYVEDFLAVFDRAFCGEADA